MNFENNDQFNEYKLKNNKDEVLIRFDDLNEKNKFKKHINFQTLFPNKLIRYYNLDK